MANDWNIDDPIKRHMLSTEELGALQTQKAFDMGESSLDKLMSFAEKIYSNKILAGFPDLPSDVYAKGEDRLADLAERAARDSYAISLVEEQFPKMRGVNIEDPRWKDFSQLKKKYALEPSFLDGWFVDEFDHHMSAIREDHEEMYERDMLEFRRMMRENVLTGPSTLGMNIKDKARANLGLPPKKGYNHFRAFGEMYASGRVPESKLLDYFVNPKAYPEFHNELTGVQVDPTPPAERTPLQETGWMDYWLGLGTRGFSAAYGSGLASIRERTDPTEPVPAGFEGPPADYQFRPEDVLEHYGGLIDKLTRASGHIKLAKMGTTRKFDVPKMKAGHIRGQQYVETTRTEEAEEHLKQHDELMGSIESRGFMGMDERSMVKRLLIDTIRAGGIAQHVAAADGGGIYKALLPDTHPSKHKGFLSSVGLEPEDLHTMSEEIRALKNSFVRRAEAAVDAEVRAGHTSAKPEVRNDRVVDYVKAMVAEDSGEWLINNPEVVPLMVAMVIGPEPAMVKGVGAIAKPIYKASGAAKNLAIGNLAVSAERGNHHAQAMMRGLENATRWKRGAVTTFRKLFVAGSEWDDLRKQLNAVSGGMGDDIIHQLMLVNDEATVMGQQFRELSRQGVLLSRKALRRRSMPDKDQARRALWDTLTGKMAPGELFDMDPKLFAGYAEIAEAAVFREMREIMVKSGASRKLHRGKVEHMGERWNYLPHEVDFEQIQDVLGRLGFGTKGTATPYLKRPLDGAIDEVRRIADSFVRERHGPQATIGNMGEADLDLLRKKLLNYYRFQDLKDVDGGKALLDHLIERAAFVRIGPGRLESIGKANTRYTHARTALAESFPIRDLERAVKSYGDRVGRSVETSQKMKGYREVLEGAGLYDEGMHIDELERFHGQIARDVERATNQAQARERQATRAGEALGERVGELGKKSEGYQKVLDNVNDELKTLAAEAEAISQRQTAVTELPRTTGFGDEAGKTWEAIGEPVPEAGLDELIQAEMVSAADAKGLEAGLAEAVPGALEETMQGRRIAAERAAGPRVTEAYGEARAAGESVVQAEQRLLDIEAKQARLRRHKAVLEDWGVAVGEARSKAALGETLETEKFGIEMTVLDGHANREWLKATGAEGTHLSDAGKVVVPRAVADQIDKLLPLQSANLQRLEGMGEVARQQWRIHETHPAQTMAGLYKEYIQPLGSFWRLGHTAWRGLPFITTNMQGGVGLAYVNNGLKIFNPKLSGPASKTALIAAFGGDDAARSQVWRFKNGQETTLGEILDTSTKYGLIRQLEAGRGLDLYGSGTSIPGQMYKLAEAGARKVGFMQASQLGDDMQKLATIFNKLDGMDRRNWATVANLVQKEAGHWLRMTPFEKDGVRNVFGFYSWYRHIVPWTMRNMAQNPDRLANFDRLTKLFNEQTKDESVFPGIGAAWMKSQSSYTMPGFAIPDNIQMPYGGDLQSYFDAPQNTLRAMVQDPRSILLQTGGPEIRALSAMLTGRDVRGKKISGLGPLIPQPGDFASLEDFTDGWLGPSAARMGRGLGETVKTFLPITDAVQKTVNFYNGIGMSREAHDLQTRAMIARYWGNLDWLYSVSTWRPTEGPLKLETPFAFGGFMKPYQRDLTQSYYQQKEIMER